MFVVKSQVRGESAPDGFRALKAMLPQISGDRSSMPHSGTPVALALSLWDVKETAEYLNVSESWVRRHLSELPHSRQGRLIRFDPDALKSRVADRKPLESERITGMPVPRRHQQGSIVWKDTKEGKVAYGIYRVDVRTANGVERKQKKVRLGSRKELPTESQARKKLITLVAEAEGGSPVPEKMTFGELARLWQAAEGPTLTKPTFDRYAMVLRTWLLPFWKDRTIQSITRYDIQLFLNGKASQYSKSSIRSMRLVLQMALSFAHLNGWISTYPCVKIKTPRITNESRSVKRAELTEQQKRGISARLPEPYSTLVFLLSRIPVRIEEALGIKETDLDGHVLTIRRVVYEGKVYDLEPKEQRSIPIMDMELLARLRNRGE